MRRLTNETGRRRRVGLAMRGAIREQPLTRACSWLAMRWQQAVLPVAIEAQFAPQPLEVVDWLFCLQCSPRFIIFELSEQIGDSRPLRLKRRHVTRSAMAKRRHGLVDPTMVLPIEHLPSEVTLDLRGDVRLPRT